jgi:hypothetical protein
MRIDRPAFNRSIDAAVKKSNATFYQSMRNPLTAACHGVRAWPEKLTAQTVASWIMANVSYPHAADAHHILEALVFENNA